MSAQLNAGNMRRGLRSLRDLTQHLTTRADDSHAPPARAPSGHGAEPRHLDVPGHDLVLIVRGTKNALVELKIEGKTQLALPILGMWTLVGTTLADGRVGLALLDSEALHLPQPTSAATEATLAVTPPREINEAQARSAYASFRGINL